MQTMVRCSGETKRAIALAAKAAGVSQASWLDGIVSGAEAVGTATGIAESTPSATARPATRRQPSESGNASQGFESPAPAKKSGNTEGRVRPSGPPTLATVRSSQVHESGTASPSVSVEGGINPAPDVHAAQSAAIDADFRESINGAILALPTRGACSDCGRELDFPMRYGPEHARACGRWKA